MSGNNGGPAFPVDTRPIEDGPDGYGHQTSPSTWQYPGMTLRDYFAANAPEEPAHWFVPKERTKPRWHERGPRLPHGTTASVSCCAKCDAYFKERAAFDDERDRRESEYMMARYTEWPWAYADAMIAAREMK